MVPETLSIYDTYQLYRERDFKELQKAFKLISGSKGSQKPSLWVKFPFACLSSTVFEINGRLAACQSIFCSRVVKGSAKVNAWVCSISLKHMGDIQPLDKSLLPRTIENSSWHNEVNLSSSCPLGAYSACLTQLSTVSTQLYSSETHNVSPIPDSLTDPFLNPPPGW